MSLIIGRSSGGFLEDDTARDRREPCNIRKHGICHMWEGRPFCTANVSQFRCLQHTHTHTHREIPPQPVAWHDLPHQKAVFRLELQGHAALEVLHGIQELYLSCLVAEPRCSSPADRHDRRLLDDSSVYRPVEPGSRTARSTQATGRSSEPGVLSKKAS